MINFTKVATVSRFLPLWRKSPGKFIFHRSPFLTSSTRYLSEIYPSTYHSSFSFIQTGVGLRRGGGGPGHKGGRKWRTWWDRSPPDSASFALSARLRSCGLLTGDVEKSKKRVCIGVSSGRWCWWWWKRGGLWLAVATSTSFQDDGDRKWWRWRRWPDPGADS